MPAAQRVFHWFALLTLPVAVVLVWWGATVTTNDVGLSVPDWPLAYGQVNPEGWTQVPALWQEHGHRWMGMIIGNLVLIQYLWQFFLHRPRFLEVSGIVLCGVGFLYLVRQAAYVPAIVIALLGIAWLALTWFSQRWPLLRGLTVTALFMVILQASLGGARVLEMSDPYGVVHGTLGQLFFCVLVFIAFASSRTWWEGAMELRQDSPGRARFWSTLLFGAVFMQLIFGAIVRHTQREHLAAQDILTTGGVFLPSFATPEALTLFMHKYWGFSTALLLIYVGWRSRCWTAAVPRLRWISPALMIMPVNQVALGIYVILTGKSFWVTNFHVLNGLGLLVLASMLMTGVWAGTAGFGLPAQPEADNEPSPA